MNLAKIKSCLNGSSDRRAVLSGPMAFDPIHLHKYFHICIYFIHQVIACFSKHVAQAIATLILGYSWFSTTQPKIDWQRGWIDTTNLPIILHTPDAKQAHFQLWTINKPHPISKDRYILGKVTIGRVMMSWSDHHVVVKVVELRVVCSSGYLSYTQTSRAFGDLGDLRGFGVTCCVT